MKILGQSNLSSKNFFGPKKFSYKKNWGPQTFGFQKNFVSQKIWVQKYLGPKYPTQKLLVKKKVLGSKEFWFQ